MKGKHIASSPFSINVVNSDKSSRRGSADSTSSLNNEKSPSHLSLAPPSANNNNINYSKPLSLEINDYSNNNNNNNNNLNYRRQDSNEHNNNNNLNPQQPQQQQKQQQQQHLQKQLQQQLQQQQQEAQYYDNIVNNGIIPNMSDLPKSPYRNMLLNTATERTPKYLFSIGARGTNFGEFHGVFGVATDHMNKRIIATDCHNNRIQVFNEEGKFIFAFGQKGNNDGEFQHPTGVGVGPRGEIVVCERLKGRIQVRM